MRRIRIGIDVGGTFTDAAAIDEATHEVIAREKLPTTHDAKEGVAAGIVRALTGLLEKNRIAPEEVVFIAHGTTQATNALLEGDVARVGILAMGSGLFTERIKGAANVGDIPLAPGKALRAGYAFVETEDAERSAAELGEALRRLAEGGAEVIVATEAFGVDDPANEEKAAALARARGLYATGGHEVSRLYGLRTRTRTAAVNASLIPRMMETAGMTEACVLRAGIGAPLMIMRCDGGVMTTAEVRRRPILTMLSGLAAGVAGVLMYERLSDGIFLEAGGTSTDISVVRGGRVMVRYSEVGGHKTCVSALDVRTLGVAGGSMIRAEGGRIVDVGPRSAHIAGLAYEVFSPPLDAPTLTPIAPCAGDAATYAAVRGRDGRRAALTLAGAANLLGSVPKGDYAEGDAEAAHVAWQALGDALGISAEEAARRALDLAADKVGAIVRGLIEEYELSENILCLAGGGGSAGVLVPYLGERLSLRWRLVKNAPIISTIGVALAMVREVVERTVVNPGPDDIRSIRREALERAMRSGASESTVEIAVEADKKENLLRAVAMGATEMREGAAERKALPAAALRDMAAAAMGLPTDEIAETLAVGRWHIFEGTRRKKRFGLFPGLRREACVLDREGIVRLQREGLGACLTTKARAEAELSALIDDTAEYGTTGAELPKLYAYCGEKQIDLSGLEGAEQIAALLVAELAPLAEDEPVALLAVR